MEVLDDEIKQLKEQGLHCYDCDIMCSSNWDKRLRPEDKETYEKRMCEE